jgi:hypothetical protein
MELDDPSKMNGRDWAALGMASEYLFHREECIKYCYRAIEIDPAVREAYAPLIRSLLNANRVSDAEEALQKARANVITSEPWHDVHYMFFAKYRKMREWGKASAHCHAALDMVFHENYRRSVDVKYATKHIGVYWDVSQKAGNDQESLDEIRKWYRRCNTICEGLSNSDCIGVDEYLYCAAICEAQCEFAKVLPNVVYDDCLLKWADLVFHPRWSFCEAEPIAQQVYYGKYLKYNAKYIRNWKGVSRGMSRIMSEYLLVMDDPVNRVSRSILSGIQADADIHESAPQVRDGVDGE